MALHGRTNSLRGIRRISGNFSKQIWTRIFLVGIYELWTSFKLQLQLHFFFIFRQNLLKRVQGNIDLSLPLTPLGAAEERKELGILPTSFLKSNLLYLYNKQGFSLESFIQLSGIVSSQGTIAGDTHIMRFFIFCPHLKLQFALRILMTLS